MFEDKIIYISSMIVICFLFLPGHRTVRVLRRETMGQLCDVFVYIYQGMYCYFIFVLTSNRFAKDSNNNMEDAVKRGY